MEDTFKFKTERHYLKMKIVIENKNLSKKI